jgi:hypothetical protein
LNDPLEAHRVGGLHDLVLNAPVLHRGTKHRDNHPIPANVLCSL